MTGVDTNVLLRYYMRDDAVQSEIARQFLDGPSTEPVFVSIVTVVEMCWVLRSRYRLSREQIAEVLLHMITSDRLFLQNEEQVTEAAFATEDGADFADVLIGGLGAWSGCSTTLTFDRDAGLLPRFTLLADT